MTPIPHSAWQSACARGRLDALAAMSQGGPWPDLVSETPCASSLLLAADNGHTDICRRLLQDGAKVDFANKEGVTPLMVAVLGASQEEGRLDLVNLLLAHGADATSSDQDGTSVLMQAAQGGRMETVQKLLAHGAGTTINQMDSGGHFALLCGVFSDNVAIVQALLAQGADPDQQEKPKATATHRGDRPMYYAVLQGSVEIAKALIAAGADVGLSTSEGHSYLRRAISERRTEMIGVLLEGGADPDAPDLQGMSPRQWAYHCGPNCGKEFETIVAQWQAGRLEAGPSLYDFTITPVPMSEATMMAATAPMLPSPTAPRV